jgi:hypothetical protein
MVGRGAKRPSFGLLKPNVDPLLAHPVGELQKCKSGIRLNEYATCSNAGGFFVSSQLSPVRNELRQRPGRCRSYSIYGHLSDAGNLDIFAELDGVGGSKIYFVRFFHIMSVKNNRRN